MSDHICTVCFQSFRAHRAKCDCGCGRGFLGALCCEGCDCGSYEEAHPKERDGEQEKK